MKKIAAGYRDDGKQAVPGLLPMPNDNNGSSSSRRYNNSQPDQPTSCYDPEEDVTNDIIQAKRSRSPSTPTIRPSQSSKRVKLVDDFGDCTNDLQETVHRLLPTGRRGGSEFGDGSPSMRQISATKGAVDYRSTLDALENGPSTLFLPAPKGSAVDSRSRPWKRWKMVHWHFASGSYRPLYTVW